MKFLIAFLCNIILLVTCDSPYHLNCDSDPCGNGKCIDLYQKTAYQCECDAGWEGKNCNHKSLLQKANHYNYNFNSTQDYDYEHNACHGECINGGTCNRVTGICECREHFFGHYCEHHSLIHTHGDVERIYSNHDQCSHKCFEKKFSNGHVCHFKYLDSTKACHCNSTSGLCSNIMQSQQACQADCQNQIVLLTEQKTVRYCSFFSSNDNLDVRACRCVNDANDWCTMDKPDQPHSTMANTVKACFSFLGIVLCFYIGKLALQHTLAMIANGCEMCCPKSSNRTELVRSESFEAVLSTSERGIVTSNDHISTGDNIKLVKKSADATMMESVNV